MELSAVPANASNSSSTSKSTSAPGSAVLIPAGDYHLVTTRPQPGDNTPILCTEPSPDWATALGTAMGATASATVTGAGNGSLGVNESSTEAITAMLGRTAGVVALRDGLYSACQAYANGIIGRDAYGLIISQYGDLLVALASGSAPGASSPAADKSSSTSGAGSTPAGVAVAVSTGGGAAAPASTSSSASKDSSGTTPASSGDSQVAIMQQEMLQAMLVVCITDQDPSSGGGAAAETDDTQRYQGDTTQGDTTYALLAGRNPILAQKCPDFLSAVVKQVPVLLTPAKPASTGTPAKPAPSTPAAKPAPSAETITALQMILAADGDYKLPPSGVDDAQTKAALAVYEFKHKISP